jgi:hypothetical protein
MPPPLREFSRKAAIVGIGETDYHADYAAQRVKAPGFAAPTVESLSRLAFERALADSGLTRADIDGLSVSFTFGGPPAQDMAELLGIKPDFAITNGNIMAGPLPVVCAAIAEGKAKAVAMVFCVASRSIGRQFGGATDAMAEGVPPSYYYFHPWGWSSQAAHWALIFSHYQAAFGAREEDLGAVAMQVRRHAMATDQAVMRNPMSIGDYMASRYIVRPLHLFDICLVNDGAVCLIVTDADRARALPHAPVEVAGWGEAKVRHDKMDMMVRQRLAPLMQEAGGQALAMAGVSLGDVGHFEGYDPATIQLINQIEGYGFAATGEGLEFCKAGQMTHGGRVPTNTAGGNLSGSYMQGWSQVAEVVRQLRHEAGARQIEGLEVSMSSLAQTDQAHPLVFTRGERR